MKHQNKLKKQFRFPPLLVKALKKRSVESGMTETKITERALMQFLAVKA